MEKKYFFVLFTISLLSISPQVFAQEELGTLIEQQKIVFEVGKHTDVRVKHIIETGQWSDNNPRIIEILPGQHSELSVTDEDGDNLSFSYDGETFEESEYIILKQKLGNYDLIVEYTLNNFLKFNDGMWKNHLEYSDDILILVENDVSMIFVNSRPIDVSNAKGINCMGCSMILEIVDDEKILKKEITSGEKKFEVEVLSNGDLKNLEFSEMKKLVNFETERNDQIFVLTIPFEMLLNPFEVYFTENEDDSLDQIDKIRKTEFSQSDTHVNLSFRTSGQGIVSILGATNEQHEIRLDQVQKMKAGEVQVSPIEEKKSGIAVPIPGTSAYEEMQKSQDQQMEQKNTLSFADELSKGQTSESSQDNTIIYVIIGIIVAVVAGVVIKLKKN